MTARKTARDSARWREHGSVWLDHVDLRDEDHEWLKDVRRLTLWAVKHPADFFARLPHLEWLDVRGGSGQSVEFLTGCDTLRYLCLNQIRGLSDLSAVSGVGSLELLRLYGLPQVHTLPDLSALTSLTRLELGSLKALHGIEPVLRSPALEELLLIRTVALDEHDAEHIRDHPTLRRFGWFAEDVPLHRWKPVVEKVNLPKAGALHPEEWFARRR